MISLLKSIYLGSESAVLLGIAAAAKKVRLNTQLRKGSLVYNAVLPLKAFGLSEKILQRDISFNLIVNDNDGKGRKGWIEIAPGIGEVKNPAQFPVVVFD
jgi:hypothetical protein